MTGELTLTGRVLPIGGVKEKTMAAKHAFINSIIFPANNKRDWDELPQYLKEGIQAHFVYSFDQVLELVFPLLNKINENQQTTINSINTPVHVTAITQNINPTTATTTATTIQ